MNVIVVLGCSKVLEGGDKKRYTPKSHAYGRLKKTVEVFNNISSENNNYIHKYLIEKRFFISFFIFIILYYK